METFAKVMIWACAVACGYSLKLFMEPEPTNWSLLAYIVLSGGFSLLCILFILRWRERK